MELLAFKLPNGVEFTIPADWWNEAGMYNFELQSAFYSYEDLPELFIRMEAIEVPSMEERQHLGHGGLSRIRMVSILRAIASGRPLPPVEVEELLSDAAYPYRLHHGAHRFFASVAAGFPSIPAVVWR